MNAFAKLAGGVILATSFAIPVLHKTAPAPIATPTVSHSNTPKIQAAILLDVSNSMDGLIDQAKAHLWNMVSVMGKAKSTGGTPQIEIALYEYGRSSNDVKEGYVKQISPFSRDLDELSRRLFALTTEGGDEYCGQVIYTALDQLAWDTASQNYKVIFIAGNEDFLQGSLHYTRACTEAKKRGVTVNTIYCGDRLQGIKEHWNLGGECGTGSFTNINQNEKIEEVPTPFDSTILVLNTYLNNTYIAYGYDGVASLMKQEEVDKLNRSVNRSVAVSRVAVKGKASLYKNSNWDLVDASTDNKEVIANIDMKTLPDSLQNKSRKELETIVKNKKTERTGIQKQIDSLVALRQNHIMTERRKQAGATHVQTLETEMEKIIRQQAARFGMKIE